MLRSRQWTICHHTDSYGLLPHSNRSSVQSRLEGCIHTRSRLAVAEVLSYAAHFVALSLHHLHLLPLSLDPVQLLSHKLCIHDGPEVSTLLGIGCLTRMAALSPLAFDGGRTARGRTASFACTHDLLQRA